MTTDQQKVFDALGRAEKTVHDIFSALNGEIKIGSLRIILRNLSQSGLANKKLNGQGQEPTYTRAYLDHKFKYPRGAVRIMEYAQDHIGETIPPELYDELSQRSFRADAWYLVKKKYLATEKTDGGGQLYRIKPECLGYSFDRAMQLQGKPKNKTLAKREKNSHAKQTYLPAERKAPKTKIKIDARTLPVEQAEDLVKKWVQQPGNFEKMHAMITHRNYALENALQQISMVHNNLEEAARQISEILHSVGYIKEGD